MQTKRKSESGLVKEVRELRSDLEAINRTRAEVQSNNSEHLHSLTRDVREHAAKDLEQLEAIRVWQARTDLKMERVVKVADALDSTDPQRPGILLRLDRSDREREASRKRAAFWLKIAIAILGPILAANALIVFKAVLEHAGK